MKILRIVSLFIVALFCHVGTSAMPVYKSYDFVDNGIYYDILKDSLEVAVVYRDDGYGGYYDGVYKGDIVLPKTVTYKEKTYRVSTIGRFAFRGCKELTSIDLGDVSTIGADAFWGCSSLSSIDLTNVSVIENGDWDGGAFAECTALTSVKFGNMATIADYAFSKCSALSQIDFGNVSTIGKYAFEECVSLTELDFQKVDSIGNHAFYNCTNLVKINLQNVRSIGSLSFWACRALKTLDLKNVSTLGSSAFLGCLNLTSVDCRHVSAIGFHAFHTCPKLMSVDLGDNVSEIGYEAFQRCNLKNVKISTKTPPAVGSDFLAGRPVLYVPTHCKEAYQQAWGVAESRVFEMNYDFVDNGIYYKITSIDQLEVAVTLGEKRYAGEIKIPATVTFKGKVFKVTSVDRDAFEGCFDITSIDFSHVSSIGDYAVRGCSGLTSVDFGNVSTIGKDAFLNCTGLSALDFKQVSVIEDGDVEGGTFAGCTGLTRVDFKNVSTIGRDAFSGCSGLKQIDFGHVSLLGERAFTGCTGLTNVDFKRVSTIGDNAFSQCTGLKGIQLGAVAIIGESAFKGCTGVTNLDGAQVSTIKGYAFAGCTALANIDLKSVSSVGNYAFSGCTGLTDINFGKVGTVGVYAFEGCHQLKSVDLKQVSKLGQCAFAGCTGLTSVKLNNVSCLEFNTFANLPRLASVDLGNAETLRDQVFVGCTGLTYLDLKNVSTIGDEVFSGCTGLTNIDFKKVSTIGNRAFANCTGIKEIDLKNVATIQPLAFENCDSLVAVKTSAKEPPAVGDNSFNHLHFLNVTLCVPEGCKEVYGNAAVWKNFFTIVETGELNTRTFTLACSANGSVVVNGQKVTNVTYTEDMVLGKQVTLQFMPDEGYQLQSVVLNGEDMTSQVQHNSLSVTVNQAMDVVVSFARGAVRLDDAQGAYQQLVDERCAEIVYVRNFDNTDWQTLYIPFAMNYADWEGDFEIARINNVHQYDDNHDGIADRSLLEAFILPAGSRVEANTPYLVKAKTAGEKTLRVTDAVLKKAAAASLDCSSVDFRYVITGTYHAITGDEMFNQGYYALSDECLQQTSAPLGAFRWYLSVENRNSVSVAVPSAIQLRVIDENGDVTGVEELEVAPVIWPANIYNVQGKLVRANASGLENLPRGIYIVNGKKVVK